MREGQVNNERYESERRRDERLYSSFLPNQHMRRLAALCSLALIANLMSTSTAGAQYLSSAGTFSAAGDYVHVSGNEASAHAWWIKHSSPATEAEVKVKLQTKKIRRFWFDSWEDATDWEEDILRPKRI